MEFQADQLKEKETERKFPVQVFTHRMTTGLKIAWSKF